MPSLRLANSIEKSGNLLSNRSDPTQSRRGWPHPGCGGSSSERPARYVERARCSFGLWRLRRQQGDVTRYLGPNACDLPLLAPGLAFNQGAGIRMAMEIGAGTSGQFDMIHTELVDRRTSRPDAYIYGHPFGIVVNEHAKR